MIDIESSVDCQEIFRITEEEASAIEAGDIEMYLSLLSPEAVFMPQNVAEKTGDELRSWLRDFLKRASIKFHNFAHGETVIRDDFACHVYSCSWTAAPRSGGPGTLMFFKGMHVLRRQPDGAWKIARNIWNSDPKPEN